MYVMQICPMDDVSFGSINMANITKNAHYVIIEVKKYIVKVDP